jgi:hypothetical protein
MAATLAHGQSPAPHKSDDDVIVPYHKHRDTRFGHDHAYPDRGAIVREVAKEATAVNYAGTTYRFHDGVWYEPRGPAFMVVAPPIGLIVPSLPSFSTVLAQRGKTVLYGNDIFYLPRPDVGGYEVVNDPSEPSEDSKHDAAPAAASVAAAEAGFAGAGTAAGAVPVVAVKSYDTGVAAMSDGATTAAPAVSVAALPAMASTVATPLAAGSASVAPAVASVAPSLGDAADVTPANKAYVYPRNGQSADQQARDRYECYRFGVAQSGFDPMRPTGNAPGVKLGAQADFERAQGVCLDAKGYAIR